MTRVRETVMSPHPTEGTLQEYLDGEVAPPQLGVVDRHVRACHQCRTLVAELASMEETTRAVLTDFVAAIPAADQALWEIRRARAVRRSAANRRRVATAASLVLIAGASWAAAMPGSPVREWWDGRLGVEPSGPIEPQLPTAVDTPRAGMNQLPLDGRIMISLDGVSAGNWVEVILADVERAAVSVPAGSSFETGPGRLHVEIEGPQVDVRIEIPEGAVAADVVVNDQLFLQKSGVGITYPGPSPVVTESGTVRLRVGGGAP